MVDELVHFLKPIVLLSLVGLASVSPAHAVGTASAGVPLGFHGIPADSATSLTWLHGVHLDGAALSEYRIYRNYKGNGPGEQMGQKRAATTS